MAGIRSLAAALVCCALIAACRGSDDGNELSPNQSAQNDSGVKLPLPPVAPALMDREELLIAVARTASAFALGQDDSEVQRSLDGHQFEFRMRFGCPAAEMAAPTTPFSVAFNEDDRTLRVSATPGINPSDPVIAAVTNAEIEAVEGFWVERPWLLAVGCPKSSDPVPGVEPGEQKTPPVATLQLPPQPQPQSSRIGIAQFFGPEESRTMRRNARAYQVTKILAQDVAPSAVGYDIILAGRLRKLADGRVIACTPASAMAPPSCVVSASFDRVSIRRGDTDELLADWGSG